MHLVMELHRCCGILYLSAIVMVTLQLPITAYSVNLLPHSPGHKNIPPPGSAAIDTFTKQPQYSDKDTGSNINGFLNFLCQTTLKGLKAECKEVLPNLSQITHQIFIAYSLLQQNLSLRNPKVTNFRHQNSETPTPKSVCTHPRSTRTRS